MCRKMEKFSYFHEEKNSKIFIVVEMCWVLRERGENFYFCFRKISMNVCVCFVKKLERYETGDWKSEVKALFLETFFTIEQREWKTRTGREWFFFFIFYEMFSNETNLKFSIKVEKFRNFEKLTKNYSFTTHNFSFKNYAKKNETFKIVSFWEFFITLQMLLLRCSSSAIKSWFWH